MLSLAVVQPIHTQSDSDFFVSDFPRPKIFDYRHHYNNVNNSFVLNRDCYWDLPCFGRQDLVIQEPSQHSSKG